MTTHCAICSRPLPPDGPSQSRCADHLNTPTKAERKIMQQQNAERAKLFSDIMARHGLGTTNQTEQG